jgi:hypothetical protein
MMMRSATKPATRTKWHCISKIRLTLAVELKQETEHHCWWIIMGSNLKERHCGSIIVFRIWLDLLPVDLWALPCDLQPNENPKIRKRMQVPRKIL